MYDLIVIGGGPAGLTATVYALRKRLNVLMITKDLGGKTNFRLALPWVQDYQVIKGLEVVNKFKSELEYLDFARHMEPVECVSRKGDGFIVNTRGGGALESKAVIVATGVKQQRLNVPGEKEFMMKGLCYSALSYAPLFIDKRVTVFGNDDLALRSAAELATVATHVNLVRTVMEPSASVLYTKLKAAKNVTVLDGYEVMEFKGDYYAESAVLKDPDGKVSEIPADGMFIELGLKASSQMVADLVECDDTGEIKVDSTGHTNVPGVFAAGDVTTGYAEQVLIAVGEGAKAALSAYEYLLPNL